MANSILFLRDDSGSECRIPYNIQLPFIGMEIEFMERIYIVSEIVCKVDEHPIKIGEVSLEYRIVAYEKS